MSLTTKVGQIFLEHPKDENYASMYEETFGKQGQSVQLFAVMEISGFREKQIRAKKPEYENLTRTIVTAFKKTYISAVSINDDTFERALASVNAALGALGARGKVSWFGRLNAALAAFTKNELYLSTTGNAVVYLERGGNFSLLSEGLAEDSKPIKIFSNFAAGKLSRGDRVILSTKQLFNYLSLDKIREEIKTEDLEDACHEIIAALNDIKNIGFAAFIFETLPANSLLPEKVSITAALPPTNKLSTGMRIAGGLVKAFFEMAAALGKFIASIIWEILRKKSPAKRKKFILVTGFILLLLTASIGFSIWEKVTEERLKSQNSNLVRAEEILNEAEAAAIYQDDSRVLSLAREAHKLLSEIKSRDLREKLAALNERIKALQNKINKEIFAANPTVLANFPMIPTDITRSPNGFLAWNRNTGTLAFYDFRTGETKELQKNQNTSSLLVGDYAGGQNGYVFLTREGKFKRLDISADELSSIDSESPNLPTADQARAQGLTVLGEGTSARLYLLDTRQNQIWRFRLEENESIGPAEGWLKTETNFAEAQDLAVDGNIFVLFGDRLEKYFNGGKQTFTLSAVSPAIQNAGRIFTDSDQQMIYLLEPSTERILVYNKTGRLQAQLKSPKFRDASDLSVDERSKILYIIAGQELLQVNY